jgi:hypothetical protein
MTAKEYFRKHGVPGCTRVANRAGTSWGYLKLIVYGHRRPSAGLAKRLVEASIEYTPKDALDFGSLLYPGEGVRLATLKLPKRSSKEARRSA